MFSAHTMKYEFRSESVKSDIFARAMGKNWRTKKEEVDGREKKNTKLFIKSMKNMLSTPINFLFMVADCEFTVVFIENVWNYYNLLKDFRRERERA